MLKTVGLLTIVMISTYVFVVYSHRYHSIYGTASLICMFLGFVFLTAVWINKNESKRQRNLSVGVVFLLIVVSYFATAELKSRYINYEFSEHGQVVKGIVVGFEQEHVRGSHYYFATVNYQFNKHSYTQRFADEKHVFLNSDSVTMLCSSSDPQLCRITAYQRRKF